MSLLVMSSAIFCYFGALLLVSKLTVKKWKDDTFFTGGRESPWYVVAYGMIGASLSGITFVSVPGWVGSSQFTYMQMVLGYIPGYIIVAYVLIPIYYKCKVVTIYEILKQKYGAIGYKTGSFFFILSRVIGSSARLYIAIAILQSVIFNQLNIPFWASTLVSLLFIFLYTKKGGIKTVVWTDILQTTVMLTSVIIIISTLKDELNYSYETLIKIFSDPQTCKLFVWDVSKPNYFWKMFLSGALIAVVMTGLDQDMMQKNLTCKNSKKSGINTIMLSLLLVPVNIIFLLLGVLLLKYGVMVGIPADISGDNLFPYIVFNYMPATIAVIFVIGIVASACSSADSALTSLTTTFSIDFLAIKEKKYEPKQRKKILLLVHIAFIATVFTIVVIFNIINNKTVIDLLFKIAGYTYGPLIGLFVMALATKKQIHKRLIIWVLAVSILSPCLTFIIDYFVHLLWEDIRFGYLLLLINGLISLLGLLLIEFINSNILMIKNKK